MSDRSLYGLIEMLLVFGLILAWAIWQWWDWWRWRKQHKQHKQRERDDGER